jgi:hypothetical protein
MSRYIASATFALVAVLFASVSWSQSGALENPQPNGVESGIGVISGWHCTARNIEIRVDGVSLGQAGAGTGRGDTQGVCGRSDTGFSLLLNYNVLGQGTHRIEALANGSVFGAATFSVGTLGSEFLTGLSRPISIGDFPTRGLTTNMRWAQSKQNFVIEGSAPSDSLPIAGTYVLTQFSVVYSNGTVLNSAGSSGITATGTMVIGTDGSSTQTVEVTNTNTGSVGRVTGTATFDDQGYYLRVTSNGRTYNAGILSRGNVLTTQVLQTSLSQALTEVDTWTRVAAGGGTFAADTVGLAVEASSGQFGGLLGSIAGGLLER